MIKFKHIICLILMICILLPATALANDGGPFLDYDQMVVYSFNTSMTEAEIGEKITFTLWIKNRTKYVFYDVYLNQLYETEPGSSYILEPLNIELRPYESKKITLEMLVPEDVTWYKQGSDYYFNLLPVLEYGPDARLPVNDSLRSSYEVAIIPPPLPIKITNLHDGYHLVDWDFVDDTGTIHFYNRQLEGEENWSQYDNHLNGTIINHLTLRNISGQDLTIVCLDHKDEDRILSANQHLNFSTRKAFYLPPQHIPENMPIRHSLLVRDEDDQYYAVSIKRHCNTNIFTTPPLRLDITKDGNALKGTLTNRSGGTLRHLMIQGNEQDMRTAIPRLLWKNEVMDLPDLDQYMRKVDETYYFNINVGYYQDNELVYAICSVPLKDDKTVQAMLGDHVINEVFVDMYPKPFEPIIPTNPPTIYVTARPSIISNPGPTVVMPTMTPTLITPSHAPTEQPTNPPTVIEVQSSYIPVWVYFALPVSIILVFALIILIRRRTSL